MEAADELILIRKAQGGDQLSFQRLVESHQAFAYSMAFRFTRSEEESEDLVQDAFVNVWKNIQRYSPEFRFKTWLGKILTNLCLDYLKSSRRKTEAQRHAPAEDLKFADPLPHDRVLEGEELNKIVWALAKQLTEKQQAAFILRDLEMLSVEEVCAMLNLAPGNLKSNLYLARQKIKEGIQHYYAEKKLE
jgi:RNA polymerase sigma-70 factor (ECF subfamily)